MTCFAAIYDKRNRTLLFANAGHHFPYRFDSNNRKLTTLVIRGNRLGDITDSKFEVSIQQLNPKDRLVFYTDGIIECENIQGEELGEKRFREIITTNIHHSPDQAKDAIIEQSFRFYGDVPLKDDITLVIAEVDER